MEKINFLWKTYDNILRLIRFSDTKASTVLATDAILTGLLFSNITYYRSIAVISQFYSVFFSITLISLAISAVFSAISIIPTTKSSGKDSLIYFNDVFHEYKDSSDFGNAVKESLSNLDILSDQLAHQIWVISKIAQKKSRLVRIAIPALVMGIILSIALVITSVGL
ncbi:MAG: DUF5706 domain-containing protein [Thermoplasmatales archaeon]|nr:DUF5706 domain-containing protein [Thermoplasmatales archaeon]